MKGSRFGKPMIKPLTSISPRGKIILDWKAYFIEFCKVHQEPILSKGRLIFRDGWSYSATSYEGPEFPPPKDLAELDALVIEYWTVRQAQLKTRILKLQHEYKMMSDLIATRSLPPQCVVYQEVDGKMRRGYAPLNIEKIQQKIAWTEEDLLECANALEQIEQHYKEKVQ